MMNVLVMVISIDCCTLGVCDLTMINRLLETHSQCMYINLFLV